MRLREYRYVWVLAILAALVVGACSTEPSAPEDGGVSEEAPLASVASQGWASRYWDCCKPTCAQPGGTARSCSIVNAPLADPNAPNACGGGTAYACWNLAPWAVSSSLAYGYAAMPAGTCGSCYQLQFTGSGWTNPYDPGSRTLAGKTMIVQVVSAGDLAGGQFDLLIPGGGVGDFNACAGQWGTSNLGAQYGGFLTSCQNSVSCLVAKCQTVFAGKPDLLAGCMFHANWMGGADNPRLVYTPIACPAAFAQRSGM